MDFSINPKTPSDIGSMASGLVAVLAAIWAGIAWPFKTFVTIKSANRIYVKKVEDDGSRNYVHPSEMIELKDDIKSIRAIVEKWQ
jgi:hypothetical protein